MAVAPSSENGAMAQFIRKLYFLLEKRSSREVVGWAKDGLSFVVYNPKLFATTILPEFFAHRKWSRFVTELSRYGFHECKQVAAPSADAVEYSHIDFQRGNVKALKRIQVRRKRELEPHRRAVVDEIEETILGIKRQIVRETKSVHEVADYLSGVFDEPTQVTYMPSRTQSTPPPLPLDPPRSRLPPPQLLDPPRPRLILPPPETEVVHELLPNGDYIADILPSMSMHPNAMEATGYSAWLPNDPRFAGSSNDHVELDASTFELLDSFLSARPASPSSMAITSLW
ncbi:hypothetical protein LEN26_015621 [Aphanomyces euteiches]|nr:hypothetical protein LEN26_015621 [Aphanomyces euteiches]KAH9113183.1 hypothetical protein AeMF1_012596 [Aphanomyces euteiches]KAH9188267.1 hypothetical protein AeNC1_009760 [Aphanomyces euteiches]